MGDSDAAARQANPGPGEKAVDVCCGTGTLAIELATKVEAQAEVWGVDL